MAAPGLVVFVLFVVLVVPVDVALAPGESDPAVEEPGEVIPVEEP